MKGKVLILAALAVVAMSGCIGVATPAAGGIYTEVKWDGGVAEKVGSKEGKACAQSILTLVASGDASIKTAAANGGIKEITAVDHETTNLLGIIGTYCTVVRGN